jgi:hypothetical protein
VVISTMNPWSIEPTHPVVDAMGWDDEYRSWRTSSLTKFTVLDITNRSQPDVDRELFIEGSYITAREVNGTVRTITHAWMDVPGVQSYLNLPTGYWNLDYDDPLRLEIREKVAYETMLSNSEALDRLSLSTMKWTMWWAPIHKSMLQLTCWCWLNRPLQAGGSGGTTTWMK